MDPLLAGQGPDAGIVAAAQLNDRTIRLYVHANGKTSHRDAEFFPFFILSDPDLIDGFPEHFWQKDLAGSNAFRSIVVFERWSIMWSAVHHVLRQYNRVSVRKAASFHEVESLFIRPDPVRQYLLQSDTRFFTGLELADLARVQIDILLRPRAPGRSAEQVIVAVAAGDGTETITLDTTEATEQEILEELFEWIRERDPDLIEGHLLFDRLLPAIQARCEALGISPLLGRDERPMQQRAGRSWHGPGGSDRMEFDIPGRHCIDTARIAADHFPMSHWIGIPPLAAVGRLLFDEGDTIPVKTPDELVQRWDREPAVVLAQMADRLRLIRRVSERLLPPLLQQARWCPLNLGVLAEMGVAARVESILLREYVRAKHSLPRTRAGSASAVAFAEAQRSGLFRDVATVHIRTLHASIIARGRITPVTDQLALLPRLASALAGGWTDGAQPEEDGAQILAAGLFSYLSSPFSFFHDAGAAQRLERATSEAVTAAIRQLDLHNATVLHADAETIFIVPPDNVAGQANIAAFVERLNTAGPSAVRFAAGARLPAMLVHRRNSFALRDERNNIHVAGSSLLPRSGERFIRRFMLRSLECILTGDFPRLHHTYASFRTMVAQHKWQVTDFCRVETIREELEEYLRELEAGSRTPSPAVEAARRSNVYPKLGARVACYVTGTHPDVRLVDSCTLAGDWDPNFPNENTAYYQQRLDDAAGRLRELFEPRDFETIFTLDDLFGFSEKGISVVERTLAPDGPGADLEGAEGEGPGIWLADQP